MYFYFDICENLHPGRPNVRCDGANPVAQIFEGKIVTRTRCTEVDFTSEKVDTFQSIQLPVSAAATATLEDSLKLYCQERTRDGDDKYDAGENLGKQRAKCLVRIKEAPWVLTLHLKRFRYESTAGELKNLKTNDSVEFAEDLDIAEYYIGEGSTKYALHAVLVHQEANIASNMIRQECCTKYNKGDYAYIRKGS